MPTLTPVDSDPFAGQPAGAGGPKLTPVDHDPFAQQTKEQPHTTFSGLAASAARGLAAPAAGMLAGAGLGAATGGPPGAAAGALAVGGTELALYTWNTVARQLGLPQAITPQEATDKLFDFIGVKRPSTGLERETQAIAGGAGGAASQALGAAEIAASSAPGLAKSVAEQAAKAPVAQAVTGGASGAGAQTAAELGAGPLGQAAAGMITATASGAVPGRVGKVVSPEARELLDAKVKLTPGQVLGGVAKRAEEGFKRIPITGSKIRSAETEAIDSFNLATANKALEPIGAVIPDGITGRDIIAGGQKALSDAYDSVVPHLSFKPDKTFRDNVMSVVNKSVATMPDAEQKQFEALILRINQRLDNNGGVLAGDNLKVTQEELTHFADIYKKGVGSQRQLGEAVDDLNDHLRTAIEDQNPGYGQFLRDIDSAYAMFVRLDRASTASAVAGGRYTPGQLLQAIKAEEPTVRKRGFARGDALLQDWGQTAYDVMGNKMPDSGSPEGGLWAGLGLSAAAPWAIPKAALGIAATSLPYAKPVRSLVRKAANLPVPSLNLPVAPLPFPVVEGIMSTVSPAENANKALGGQ